MPKNDDDNIKIGIVALVVLIALAITYCIISGVMHSFNPAQWSWFNKSEQAQVEEPGEIHGKAFNGAGEEMYYGVTYDMPDSLTFSHNGNYVDAKNCPEIIVRAAKFADGVKVDWSATYNNGADASDAVKITPTSDGSATARIKCLKSFNERITVKAARRDKPNVLASCKLNYISRVVALHEYSIGGSDFDDPVGFEFDADIDKGTVKADLKISGCYNLKDEFKRAVQSLLNFNLTFKAFRFNAVALKATSGTHYGLDTAKTAEQAFEYGMFIEGYDNFTAAEKEAVRAAWYQAFTSSVGYSGYNILVDVTVYGEYNGVTVFKYSETEFIGNGNNIISGEVYGRNAAPSSSLVKF